MEILQGVISCQTVRVRFVHQCVLFVIFSSGEFAYLCIFCARVFRSFLCFIAVELDESSSAAMTPEQEAKKIMQTIRKHVRMLNRKWAELKQKSIEWQHKLEQCLPVS